MAIIKSMLGDDPFESNARQPARDDDGFWILRMFLFCGVASYRNANSAEREACDADRR